MGLKTAALRNINAFPGQRSILHRKPTRGQQVVDTTLVHHRNRLVVCSVEKFACASSFEHANVGSFQKTFRFTHKLNVAVTILGLLLMITLFAHELKYQLTTVVVHEMSVDVKRGQKLPIFLNMTFPALPCAALSLDAMDLSGKHEVDLDTNIWKIRINKEGFILGSEYVSDLVEGEHVSDIAKEEAAAKKALEDAGHFHHDSPNDEHGHGHGHVHEHKLFGDPLKAVKDIKKALDDHEGCRIFGVLDVERVAGNFHISMHGLSIFVAQQVYGSVSDVNVSHVIHDLSFGPTYPGLHNPLDGTERILHEESGTFKYFLKVVPTEYSYLSGVLMPTNQFSVTEYFTPAKPFEQNWPAVYFVYDLSPIAVNVREQRRHLGHFFTRICAVLGEHSLSQVCWIGGFTV